MPRRILLKMIVVVLALVGLLLVSSPPTTAAPGATGLARAIEVQERNSARFMAIEGVVGTAVTYSDLGAPAVVVLLERPIRGAIPKTLDGVPVRATVTGKIYALPKPDGKGKPPKEDPPVVEEPTRSDKWPRPVPIGISTGHPAITAGTIGCRVTRGDDVFALSNNHVYANQNAATIGDAVIQPGTYDGGSSTADDIGTLFDFEPIDFSGDNVIDAAIALTSSDDLGNATPSAGYGTPKSTIIAPAINMPVMKFGRTTGFTKGRIYAINATVNVGYDGGVARFVGQIIITPGSFSAGGDSGSLIVADGKGRNNSDKGKPVGLLFAGSSSYTVANPIYDVLDAFGVTIDGK